VSEAPAEQVRLALVVVALTVAVLAAQAIVPVGSQIGLCAVNDSDPFFSQDKRHN
jgi:hypothetical protein